MAKLIYGALPSRLISKKDDIMKFVAMKGNGCLCPFNALPYAYFEGGILGRVETIKVCFKLIDICDEFWIFGVSEGTLIETDHVLKCNKKSIKPKLIKVYIKKFDNEWLKYYSLYKKRFGSILSQLSL